MLEQWGVITFEVERGNKEEAVEEVEQELDEELDEVVEEEVDEEVTEERALILSVLAVMVFALATVVLTSIPTLI